MLENHPTSFAPEGGAAPPPRGELVFLLHGFGGRPLLMSRVARHLAGREYAIRNWTYPSLRKPVAHHAASLRDELARVTAERSYARVHFVTHSLGGVVVRQLLCREPPGNVGRIVMLAPPNAGSHVAWISSVFLRGLCPVLREISDRKTSFVNALDEPGNVEIGIIAGSGDWVVRQRSTHLASERDHIVLRGGHLRLPFLRTCALQTEHFLRHGTFDHEVRPPRHRRGGLERTSPRHPAALEVLTNPAGTP